MTNEELLIAIANTGHGERDEFADASGVKAWWVGIGGDASGPVGSAPEGIERLRALRTIIRVRAWANNRVDATPESAAAETLAGVALRFDGSGAALALRAAGSWAVADAIVGAGITALLGASSCPAWPRFKACRSLDCGWVFVDASRNASRRWCDMGDCGNRAKGAAFRARARRQAG